MKIIEQSWTWEQKPKNALAIIERAGRTCYKTEKKIQKDSAELFVRKILKLGHETVLEHVTASVRFITNRGVTHELVRHRLSSFSQESTRYVKYQEIEFIKPVWWADKNYPEANKARWKEAMQTAEKAYQAAILALDRPEQAREVLPQALKVEIVMTANLRQWRNIFNLRCAPQSHPQIRALMRDCLRGFAKAIPVVFDDLLSKYRD
jgi:thymidylate synthase (FAD)